MPAASAFGGMYTHPSPTSRGLGCFVSFLMGRTCVQTAASPRAGTCRLRRFWGTIVRFPPSPVPRPPQADGPCSWAVRRVYALSPEQKRNAAPKPPAHGAWVRESEPKALACGTAAS